MAIDRKPLIALTAGAITGAATHVAGLDWLLPVLNFIQPVGMIFLRLVMMIVVPLLVASMIICTASASDVRRIGRVGGRILLIDAAVTVVAACIGLLLASAIRPGAAMDASARDASASAFMGEARRYMELAVTEPSIGETLLDIVPSNPFQAATTGDLVPLIVFSLMLGVAIGMIAPERRSTIVTFFNGIYDAASIMAGWVLRLAPYAVFALVANAVASFRRGVLDSLIVFALIVLVGYAIVVALVYAPLVRFGARLGVTDFAKRIIDAPIVALSTASTDATLPVTVRVAQDGLGISRDTASLAVPLGATLSMHGTALYLGAAALFIAQIHGVSLSLVQQLVIILMATIGSIATPGIPGAGITTLVIVLHSVGMDAHAATGIAIVLAVDPLLDMIRTGVNVTGDLAVAAVVARSEGESIGQAP